MQSGLWAIRPAWRAMVAIACLAAPAAAAPQGASAPRVTDAQVQRAISRGLAYLFSVQDRTQGTWTTQYDRRHPGGADALVALTALWAGEKPTSPRLKADLDYLAGLNPRTTYVRALRAMVFARLNGAPYTALLSQDATWLVRQQLPSGGWGYGPDDPTTRLRPDWTDASNSQMALLGLRDAADAGATVPRAVWDKARAYWLNSQNPDGGWGYEPPGRSLVRLRGSSHGSMTAAGLASLYILAEKQAAHAAGGAASRKQIQATRAALQKARQWLAKNYELTSVPGWVWGPSEEWTYYYHFALVRAASAGGMRTIGSHDWFRELAALLLSRQRKDGGWAAPYATGPSVHSDLVRTCFVLLTLLKGSAPVMMNKMMGTGPADADFLDAANVTRWVSAACGKGLSWQAVEMSASAAILREAPLLYLSVDRHTDLSTLPGKAIRDYLLHGGTVLVNAAGEGQAVANARKYFLALMSAYGYQAADIGASHPIWHAYFKIHSDNPPRMIGLSDACRTHVFILTHDEAATWQDFNLRSGLAAFQLVGNLVFYSTDLALPPGKLAATRLPPAKLALKQGITVCRVRHVGDWDACPLAMGRLSDALGKALSFGVVEGSPVDLNSPVPSNVTVLWMTGSKDPALTADQGDHLKKYLEDGGTLFVDSTVGRPEFADAMASFLGTLFGADKVKPLPADSPLLTGHFGGGIGCDLRGAKYTREGAKVLGDLKTPPVYGVEVNGRLAVVFCKFGVTCGVEGLPTFGDVGLAPDDARRLAANVLLYALLGRGQ